MLQSVMSGFRARFKRLAPKFALIIIAMHVYVWTKYPDFLSFMHHVPRYYFSILLCHALLSCIVPGEVSNCIKSGDDDSDEPPESFTDFPLEEASGGLDDGVETGGPEFNTANGLLMVDSYFDINGNPFGTTFNDD